MAWLNWKVTLPELLYLHENSGQCGLQIPSDGPYSFATVIGPTSPIFGDPSAWANKWGQII